MTKGTISSTDVPDRRRTHFARNGGPRPNAAHRRAAKVGIEAARAALEAVKNQAA